MKAEMTTSSLVLGRTWFGSRQGSVFGGSVVSSFIFWGQPRGSVLMKKPKKIALFCHPIKVLSKVRGSFLGGSVGSRFSSQKQTGGSRFGRFGFWKFGIFRFDLTLF